MIEKKNSVVWKQELHFVEESQIILVKKGAEVLHFGDQRGIPCLWFRINPYAETEERIFVIRGTGHPGALGTYIGTALFDGGSLVFHLFEEI